MKSLSPLNLGFSQQQTASTAIPQLSSTLNLPPAAQFGKGVVQVGSSLYVSDGVSWITGSKITPLQQLKDKLLITDIDNTTWVFSGTGVIKRLSASHAVNQNNTIEINHDGTTSGQTAQALAPWVGDLSSYDYIEVAYYSDYYPSSSRTSITIAIFTSSPGTADNAAATIFLNKPGWNIARIKKSLFTISGAFNWADIKQIRFNVTSSTVPRVFFISRMYAVKAKTNLTTFTINYDDGFSSSEYSCSLAIQRGLQAGMFIIDDKINTTGYFTSAQLKALANRGIDLMLHGAAEGFDNWHDQIGSQGVAGFDAAIKNDIQNLQAAGGNKALMSYPQGIFHKTNETLTAANYGDIISTLRANGVIVGRTVKWSDSTDQVSYANYNSMYPKNPMFFEGAFSLNNSITLVQAKALVDEMINWGGVFSIYGHKIAAVADSVSWTEQDTIDLFDYIADKQRLGLCYVDSLQNVVSKMLLNGMLSVDED